MSDILLEPLTSRLTLPAEIPFNALRLVARSASLFLILSTVVHTLSVSDVMEGSLKMPFTSRVAWLATQQECPDLRRTHSHLTQGTRPSKKLTKIPDVKRYLKDVSVARDGLLVVLDLQPFQPPRERIVVPCTILDGLLTAMYILFNHPLKLQSKKLFTRYFYALDLDSAIDSCLTSCHHCQSVKSLPTHLHPQSTTEPPSRIGSSFAVDIMRRYRQYILVLWESVSSYTFSAIIDNEQRDTLHDCLLTLCADFRFLDPGGITIHVDSAPGFQAWHNDAAL